MKTLTFIHYLKLSDKVIFIASKLFDSFKSDRYKNLNEIHKILDSSNKIGFEISNLNNLFVLNRFGESIYMRKKGSDLLVFRQIFINNEYIPVIKLLVDNHIKVTHIIDAGSNIGLTSLQLFSTFPDAEIICIEPDFENQKILELNLKDKILKKKCHIIRKALWSSESQLTLHNSFRDGKEWSRSVTSKDVENSSSNMVASITINNLVTNYKISNISLLKIDIEGAENEIFNKKNNQDFLKLTNVIALEIHDEVSNREEIYEILRSYNFLLFNSGELTIGINKGKV